MRRPSPRNRRPRRPSFLAALVMFVVVAAVVASSAVEARAHTEDFHLVAHSVAVDEAAGTATFSLTFDREPRFFLPHGGGGAQPNAFQYEIDADTEAKPGPVEWDDIDVVVRGAEIFRGDGIPIRDRDGDGGNNAGGWGAVRSTVPFDLDDNTLTFTAGLDALADDGDGHFRYRLITTQDGGLTSEVQGAVIPLPAAVWGGLVMMGAAGVAARRGRH